MTSSTPTVNWTFAANTTYLHAFCNLQLSRPHLPLACGKDQLTGLRGVPLPLSDHQHMPRTVECGHYWSSAYWHLLALKWGTPLCTAGQLDRLSLMEYDHPQIHVPVNMQWQCKATSECKDMWQYSETSIHYNFGINNKEEIISVEKASDVSETPENTELKS
jgi:hypothetical protein